MSSFKNPRFAKELAYRTMVNYYNLLYFKPDLSKAQSYELQRVLRKMNDNGYETTQSYEVTLALNSLIGLLVLPQQEYYSESLSSCNFFNLPELERCINDRSYKNTYKEDKCKPANVLKHMRNSVAHDRIMIIPEAATNENITHVRFRDAVYGSALKPFRNNSDLSMQIASKERDGVVVYEFDLTIPVEKLEVVLMEIAEYLIGFSE